MHGRVLIVAGSDSGGGAGIQADIKAVSALDGFAATAVTALTAQNTLGVHGVVPVDPAFVARQMEVVLTDLGADAVKTGMLHSAEVIASVADVLSEHAPEVPLVVDPVMVAKGGAALIDPDAVGALIERLVPRADLLTPNIPEAERLAGLTIASVADMRAAAGRLLQLGAGAVLIKGGHLEGAHLTDLLAWPDGERIFKGERIDTPHTHGTGCTLASAIAAGLAQDLPMARAVVRARAYLIEAIRTAPGYGAGHGPLNHTHPLRK